MDESCTIWDLGVRQFTSDTVMEYSASQGITIEEALDTIVREWKQFKEEKNNRLSFSSIDIGTLIQDIDYLNELASKQHEETEALLIHVQRQFKEVYGEEE